MGKRLHYSLIVSLLIYFCTASSVLAAAFQYESWGRLPGAAITNSAPVAEAKTPIGTPLGNCNPDADPSNDAQKNNDYEKSCTGQAIDRDNFKVSITFDPKEPQNLAPVTVQLPGPPTLPNGTTSVWTSSKVEFPVTTGCSGQFICEAGKPLKFASNGDDAYEEPIPVKIPESGNVQTYAGYVEGATAPPSGGPSDMVYARGSVASGTVIHNTKAVGSYGVGAVSCTVGNTQPYASGQPVKTAECEISLDIGKCVSGSPTAMSLAQAASLASTAAVANPTDPGLAAAATAAANAASNDPAVTGCNIALISGNDQYNADGTIMTTNGAKINAVDGPLGSVTQITNLYHTVFNDISEAQAKITNAVTFELGAGEELVPDTAMLARFVARDEGSSLCIYATVNGGKEWRVEKAYPQSLNEVYDVLNPSNIITPTTQPQVPKKYNNPPPGNCVRMPPPAATMTTLQWSNLVAPVCLDRNVSSTHFRFDSATGTVRSFTGIIVECIEDTMMNLFYPTAMNVDDVTFFSAMQDRMKGAIRLLMVLYLIFFGYKLMMGKEVPKREEWTWLMLKLVLVAYFAAGSGMTDLLPVFRAITTNVSAVVMDAGLEAAASDHSGITYNYCDFRDSTKFSYPAGREGMKLWDMIDCKITKYLGLGDSTEFRNAPMVILIALLAPISVGMGIPIFFIALMMLLVVISITMRIVHIYVMAFMAMMMLVYISPLVIPAVFFENTKGIFSKWLEQLIGFILQPIILFGFLSFMFIMLDGAMFGGNHAFSQNEYIPIHLADNSGAKISHTNANCGTASGQNGCSDENALGYLYQITKVNTYKWPWPDKFEWFEVWNIDFRGHDMAMFVGLSKMLLISFIAYCLLGTVEGMSGKLVAIAESGAEKMSQMPAIGPAEAMAGIAKAVGGAKDFAATVGKGVGRGVGRGVVNTPGAIYDAVTNQKGKAIANKEKDIDRDAARKQEKANTAGAAANAAKENEAAARAAAAESESAGGGAGGDSPPAYKPPPPSYGEASGSAPPAYGEAAPRGEAPPKYGEADPVGEPQGEK